MSLSRSHGPRSTSPTAQFAPPWASSSFHRFSQRKPETPRLNPPGVRSCAFRRPMLCLAKALTFPVVCPSTPTLHMHSLDNESGPSKMAADMDAPTPTPSRPREYHVLVEGQMHGPFSAESLKAALESGDITQEDLVQVGGLPIWRPLRQVLESPEPRNFASAEAALAATAPPSASETETDTETEADDADESDAESDAESVAAPEQEAVESKPLGSLFVPEGEAPPDWIVISEWARSRLRADYAERPVGIGLIFLGAGAVACIAAHWPF